VAARGDITVVAVAVAVAVGGGWVSAAALVAVGGVALRWGTTDLAAIGGAVGALGPAVRVGPPSAAAACALAGLALLIASASLRAAPGPGPSAPGGGEPSAHQAAGQPAGRIALGAAAALAIVGPTGQPDASGAALAGGALVLLVAACVVAAPRLPSGRLAGPAAFALAVAAAALAAAW